MINCHVGVLVILVLTLFIQERVDADDDLNTSVPPSDGNTEEDAKQWLKKFNKRLANVKYKTMTADWNYSVDITDGTSNAKVKAEIREDEFDREAAAVSKQFDVNSFTDESLKRQLRFINSIKVAALDEDDGARFSALGNEMETIYNTATICPPSKPDCDLEKDGWSFNPEIESLMRTSRNYSELQYVWIEWREMTGKKMKDQFLEHRDLLNVAALEDGFGDAVKMRLDAYQRDLPYNEDFRETLEHLWSTLMPMYKQLHAFVRHKLMEYYGSDYTMTGEDPIPAHLFGNMWAQSWENIYDIVKPFDIKEDTNVTQALIDKGYNAVQIFKTAEEFFESIGWDPMPDSFWEMSMLEKPKDRDVQCHASASDFYLNNDVRIKQCTSVTSESFITAHHEMGHCEYYQLYADQPTIFRRGANPGFHEAVGDTISLSVQTAKHLYNLKLLDKGTDTDAVNINFLMKMALKKIAFLPFGYLIDLWRWDMYTEEVEDDKANRHWWKLREEYQGIIPPVMRDHTDFDPGAKYHVAADVPYIRYFVASILQFSFYSKACEASGHTGDQPLHTCDFNGSIAAGYALGEGLKLGRSRPWPEILKGITGSESLNAFAIIEYFKPLIDYISKYNTERKIPVGWKIEAYKYMVEPCLEKPCHNNGTCVVDDLSFKCICQRGFIGDLCMSPSPEFDHVAAIVGGLVGGVLLLVLIISGVVFYTTGK